MAVDKELRHLQERQSERERDSVPRTPVPADFLDAMSQSELKDVVLDLFDQIRDLNARLAEKDRAMAEKDRANAALTEKLDAVLENQRQQKLDQETWLAKERRWNKEREAMQKTIADLNDIVKVLKKAKFVGTSQKSGNKTGDKDKDNDGIRKSDNTAASAGEPDLAENKDCFDGKDEDGSIAAAADKTEGTTSTTRSPKDTSGRCPAKGRTPCSTDPRKWRSSRRPSTP